MAFEQDDSGNKFVSAAEAWDVEEKIHIFIKELWIASRGAMIGSRGHEVLRSFIDNAAAHHCMRKGHSSVFYANILLQAVFGTEKTPKPVHVESVLVPSAEVLADTPGGGENGRLALRYWSYRMRTRPLETWVTSPVQR